MKLMGFFEQYLKIHKWLLGKTFQRSKDINAPLAFYLLQYHKEQLLFHRLKPNHSFFSFE